MQKKVEDFDTILSDWCPRMGVVEYSTLFWLSSLPVSGHMFCSYLKQWGICMEFFCIYASPTLQEHHLSSHPLSKEIWMAWNIQVNSSVCTLKINHSFCVNHQRYRNGWYIHLPLFLIVQVVFGCNLGGSIDGFVLTCVCVCVCLSLCVSVSVCTCVCLTTHLLADLQLTNEEQGDFSHSL